MTFADLNLPYGCGLGVWTHTAPVTGGDWAAAESALVEEAQAWVADHEGAAGAYHTFRDEAGKSLTLDLMRGA